jgi:hypothetical protein
MFSIAIVQATQEQIRVDLNEYVTQTVLYNPLKTGDGIWFDANENQSTYSIVGYITVKNNNPNGKTISDIYVSLSNTQNMSLPTYYIGRTGTFVSNNTASGNIILHIPELESGQNSTWTYTVNTTAIRPPLNLSTSYSDTKLLAGDNFTVTDVLENVFDNYGFQTDTCIYGINLTQVTVPVNFSGVPQDYYFTPSTTAGPDASNVSYSADNKTQYWNVLAGGCLYKTNSTSITYDIQTPLNIPKTTDYTVTNTTLIYNLNNTISHLRVIDITAISEGNLSFEKKIVAPSHPTLYGSNVTWNVTGYFNTGTNITYNLSSVTLWVSQRNVNGSYTDPNTVDNDSISNASLTINYAPNVLVNSSTPWASSGWLFNYSDIPSPIVWMDINFTIQNDGTQLINRSVTQNGNDIYIKELYLIIGYWLEINKNITSLGNDSYQIKIDVHNKGNQVTPADSVVTIYDFVPSNFNVSSPMVYSTSPWYTTAASSNNVSGGFNGTLWQWGIIPTNILNTSFAQGPAYNANTTWSVTYNVTGQGDYQVLDVFVTGLDPQQVDGAGSTQTTIVTEILDRLKGTEGVFAAIASVLLLFSLLV